MSFLSKLKGNYILNSKDYPSWVINLFFAMAGVLNFLLYHKKSKPDIFILSSLRSGSTWLAEIIYRFPKVKYVQEPFSRKKRNLKKYLYPIQPSWTYTYNDITANERQVINYIENQSKGKYVTSRRYDVFSSSFNFYTNRSVIKLLRTTPISDWLINSFKEDIFIILVRHPIATSLSKIETEIRKDFEPTLTKYFKDRKFVETFLSQEIINKIETEKENYSELEQEIVVWCLDNISLIQAYQKNKDTSKVIFVTYEELATKTELTLKRLCEFSDLPYSNNILQESKKASASTRYNKQNETNKMETNLLSKWRKQVSESQERKIFEIITLFKIDIYEFGNDFPIEKYLLLNTKK